MADRKKLLNDLEEVIKRKQEIRERKQKEAEVRNPDTTGTTEPSSHDNRSRRKPTRADTSRANGTNSHGPITPEGKARVSANSLKHGFFANVEKLHPQDAPSYQRLHQELSYGLLPYGAVEELMVRELAMLTARLRRLEAAEYALICSELEAPAPPPKPTNTKSPDELEDLLPNEPEVDSRAIAAAFINVSVHLTHLHRIEAHLRRAYNRTWDRLRMMQKERKKFTAQELSKQTHEWISAKEETRNHSLAPDDFPLAPDKNDPPDHDRSPRPQNLTDPNPNRPRKEPPSA